MSLAASEALDQDWAQCAEILNVSRRSLVRGVKLLDSIDAIAASENPDEVERAGRLLYIFRNRGLGPTLRMIGESDEVESSEPDCNEWRAPGDNALAVGKFCRKTDSEIREAGLSAATNHLSRFEKLAARHNLLTPRMVEALELLRQGVSRKPLRVA